MHGRITYLTTLASTPVQSPFTVPNFEAIVNVEATTLSVGAQQDLYLYWGYMNDDPYHNDIRNLSRSAAGVVEISLFGTTQGFKFSLNNIIENRAAAVNEYAIMNALSDELMAGTLLQWYPDFDNFPTEYFSCVAAQRIDPKRVGTLFRWQFDFDLMVLPMVQFPSTVPAFQVS